MVAPPTNTDPFAGYIEVRELRVGQSFHDFVVDELLPGSGLDRDQFWTSLSAVIHDNRDHNGALLERRAEIQAAIDQWHCDHRHEAQNAVAYRLFLEELRYIVPEGPDFAIDTANIDHEIAQVAAPQLGVPLTNARYALNVGQRSLGFAL